MTELSKEASRIAFDLDRNEIAAALQKLMDERDRANYNYADTIKQREDERRRAEAAEKERDAARRVARVLVSPTMHLRNLRDLVPEHVRVDVTDDEMEAVEAALAYPEVPHG